MKKLLTALSVVIGLGLANAQQVAPAATTTQTKSAKPAVSETVSKPGVKLKKDGTPDKRYKANKRLKKDGTPDKRYKENK